MRRELRIIDGVCKVVNIDKKGNIIGVVGDYQKPKLDECKIREYEESEKRRHKEELELARQEKEMNEYNEKMVEKEKVHEIHHGKRQKYQRYNMKIRDPDPYRKRVLQNKVELGIIDKVALNIKSSNEVLNDWARKRGFHNYEEYLNIIALGRGFTCYGEYEKVWSYYPGMPNVIKENRIDNRFIGVYIAENGINKIYDKSKRMKINNVGYDIVCPKGYKIDVKATVLNKYNNFDFAINKNKIADYFTLVGFNNIIELEPLHLWIIRSDENVYRPINELYRFKILNEPIYINRYKKYEKLDKLETLKNICKEFDAKSKMETKDYNVTTRREILDTITQIRSEIKGNISHSDILSILEKKKKETIRDRLKIVPDEDVR